MLYTHLQPGGTDDPTDQQLSIPSNVEYGHNLVFFS